MPPARPRIRGKPKASFTVEKEHLPTLYDEMLNDAISSASTKLGEDGQKVKRRRVGGRIVTPVVRASSPAGLSSRAESTSDLERQIFDARSADQVLYTDADNSSDDSVEWEDVVFGGESANTLMGKASGTLDLILETNTNVSSGGNAASRRKPLNAAERSARLAMHKLHLLCTLVHLSLRNSWCNDTEVKYILRKGLSKRTLSCFDDDAHLPQLQKSRAFVKGLEQACESFRTCFRVTERGISRAYWVEDPEIQSDSTVSDDFGLPMDRSDFRLVARKLEASRDVGAQLFCALLRSAGVETRLVCSLQVLPLTSSTTGLTKLKSPPTVAMAHPELQVTADDQTGRARHECGGTTGLSDPAGAVAGIQSNLSSRFRRSRLLDQTANTYPTTAHLNVHGRKRFHESSFPVFWVEAFDSATQQWIAVDPLVTQTIGKPLQLEPPANDAKNTMTYVIAFEEDGFAKDVTRRYCKAYNAKTRRARVEIAKDGERWWRRALRLYRRPCKLDRDQVEDAALASKEAREGMPRNIADFKGHPYYALERHLRRNEVIHPKREVGKVNIGRTSPADSRNILEPVYRRRDVHIVKSADSWYRLGREIKPLEQPLKYARAHQPYERAPTEATSDDEATKATAMYAGFQTIPYKAPPVVNGRVPKNAYGNLDVYVPSMVPSGGSHIPHPDTAKAARLLGIDYSEAVTGFEFKGRRGIAIIKGAVVSLEYKEAVEEVIRGFEFEEAETRHKEKITEVLQMWKHFLTGLRVMKRINRYDIEGADSGNDEDPADADVGEDEEKGGGFVVEREDLVSMRPSAGRKIEYHLQYPKDVPGRRNDNKPGGRTHFAEDTTTFPANPLGVPLTGLSEFQTEGSLTWVGEREASVEGQADASLHSVSTPNLYSTVHRLQFPPDADADLQKGLGATSSTAPVLLMDHSLGSDALEEAHLLQQIHDSDTSSANQLSDRVGVTKISGEEAGDFRKLTSVGMSENSEADLGGSEAPAVVHNAQTDESMKASEPTEASEDESCIEKGSLVSNDPSDEEADPDWLA